MVKETRFDWNPLFLRKHNHFWIKFGVSILLFGIAFRLYGSQSFGVTTTTPITESSPFIDSSVAEEKPVVPSQEEDPEEKPVVPSQEEEDPEEKPVVPSQEEDPEEKPVVPSQEEEDPEEKPVVPSQEEEDPEIVVDQTSQKQGGECNLFVGEWIRDPSGPMYTNESCHLIEDHQNCMTNGRPDSEYLYWRWNPRDCELPRFDPKRFLQLMRNKSWAFIGDSISRNHVQSLLCMLSKVERGVEVYHDEELKSTTLHFVSYNFTLSVIWSPFLVKAAIFEDRHGVSTSDIQLHLDELDAKWKDLYQSFDYMIISGGKWFLKTAIYYENTTILGCHYCAGKNFTEFGFENAYRKALQFVLNSIVKSNHKGLVLLRTATPDHFEGGEWFSGGTCKRTVPFKEGEISLTYLENALYNVELEEFEKAAAAGSKKNVNLKLMDTTQLSLLRPDGHPGPYRQYRPFSEDKNAKVQNDCLHWCLPGPIDSWNDLLMEMVANGKPLR